MFLGHQQVHIPAELALSLRLLTLQGRAIGSRSWDKLLVNPAVANGIRDGHNHLISNAMVTDAEEGMVKPSNARRPICCVTA